MFRGIWAVVAVLAVLALSTVAAADSYSLNLSANGTFTGTASWESVTGGSLTVNGSVEVRDGNSALLWNWTPYRLNATVDNTYVDSRFSNTSSYGDSDRHFGASDADGSRQRIYVAPPSTCLLAGTLNLTFSKTYSDTQWARVWKLDAPVDLRNLTWNTQPANMTLVWTSPDPLNEYVYNHSGVLPVPYPANATYGIMLNVTPEATFGGGDRETQLRGLYYFARDVSAPCAPVSVTLPAAPAPLRVNGTGAFSVTGTVSTDKLWVTLYAQDQGNNMTANFTLNSSGANFVRPTNQWVAVKAGTYSASTDYLTGCNAPATFSFTRNMSDGGCTVVAVAAPAAPAQARSAGGGGGSVTTATSTVAAPSSPTDPVITKSLGAVPTTGGKAVATFESGPVGTLSIEVAAPAVSVTVSVQGLSSPPTSAPAPPSVASGSSMSYKWFQAEVQGAQVKQAFVDFTVDDQWLASNQADSSTVALNRLHDGSWQPLATRTVGRVHDGILFEATTPGFSVFVVTAEKQAPPTPEPAQPRLVPAVQATTPGPVATQAPTPPARSPGFEAVFAVAGLLAVALLSTRKR